MKKIFTLIAMMVLAITANAEVRSWDFTKGANYPQVAEDAANWTAGSKGRYLNANALDNQALILNGEAFALTNGLTFKCAAEKVMFGITGEFYMQCQGTVVMTIPNVAKGDTLVLGVCSNNGKNEAIVSGNISESISELSSKKQIYTVIATEAGDLALTMNNRVRLYTLDVKPAPAPADFSALAQLIAQAQEMDKEELAQAIADAICVWDTPTSTQEQVDAAVEELQAAIDALPKDEWVDVTAQYLSNYGFDDNFNYKASDEAGNVVANDIYEVDGWIKHTQSTIGVAGVYQYGTPKTVTDFTLPSTGIDGTANGGFLVSRPTGARNPVSYCVDITEANPFAAGEYMIEIAMYHIGNTDLRIQNRFNDVTPVEEGAPAHKSEIYGNNYNGRFNLPADTWVVDTIEFKVDEPSVGHLYLTISGPSSTSAPRSGICYDYVKILYKPTADAIKEVATVEETVAPKAKKAMVNGKIVIVKNGKMFNIAGVEQK